MTSRSISIRKSAVHGRGAFATRRFQAEETVIEYTGERISWQEAADRYNAAGTAGHTFYFDLGDDQVIDGGSGGNAARWINHSCAPNCAAELDDGRVVISTLHDVSAGEELTLDYNLIIEDDEDPDERLLYRCACGSPGCRGTMLAPTD
ncbi:SET domain-containing protein-lysine N-methyltransferase [Jatrophihabitans telluris]|uniref:SET domain-containing protein-lysine N-methyltransferase n=1 Tax=Jatrophihabitans telluris TaxID=2038343 RepID=A0ABY4QX43_9ACTN|nr:SET domain-containing protein-lysine N-methyltransferase [Jatrophihabitans telluris]UQX87391.1 SET domain-containing protein-lysine N-methyltransferase [Jatrophihabitans telluris]